MTRNLQNEQLESLQAAMRARQTQLREEIRQALIKSDSEHYLQIADSVRELEDESFADLIVDVGLAEIDRDLDELRAIDAALLRVADGSYGVCETCDKPIDVKRLTAACGAAALLACAAAPSLAAEEPGPCTLIGRTRRDLAWPAHGLQAAFRFSEQATFVVAANLHGVDAVAVEPQTHAPPALRRLVADEPGAPALLAPGDVLAVDYELHVERNRA